ncbi:dephospho-CoA kinase [Janibacter indicus]|uniref:dephospho-CoA kinase n=1 Tax=Janibacter indicus TaxID=857417 RepID=UPI003EB7C018
MLRIGLTGGIGSGKSTVSARLAELGAVVVDADKIAREVVEPGEPALEQIRERFGDAVFAADGALDRPALGRVVFGDPQALADLEGITHPAIWRRTAERFARAEAEGAKVGVHDMPLLVEKAMAGEYHLVVVVHTDEEVRLRRLVELRGMPLEEARSRIAAQATDEQRRAAADVLLDNNGTPEEIAAQVDRLWEERVTPFADNLAAGRRREREPVITLADPDVTWTQQAQRQLARLAHALGDRALTLDHIGSTAVPGLVAKDVLDLQVGVESMAAADATDFVAALEAAGFPRVEGYVADTPRVHGGAPVSWPKRFHGNCDPGVAVHVHVREVGSPGWRWALLFRDWLRAEPAAREEYAAVKRGVETQRLSMEDYAEAKEPWFDGIHDRLEVWARESGWTPEGR